jgi:hypothetical protein
MERLEFTLIYDGPALKDGKMDIQELAPALLGLGDLIAESNRKLNGESVKTIVNVKAGFERGSWGVAIELVQSFCDKAINALSGEFVTSALNLVDIIGLVKGTVYMGGLFGVVKWIRNRKIKRTSTEGNKTTLTVEDDKGEETIEISNEIAELLKNYKVREGLEKVVKPLKADGIEELKSEYNNVRHTIVEKNEASYCNVPKDEGEQINEYETTVFFSIRTLSFQEGNKWTLFDGEGQSSYSVKITDREFLQRVHDNREFFSEGDILKIRLKTIQYKTTKGLKTEYEATKVLGHETPKKSIQIEFYQHD